MASKEFILQRICIFAGRPIDPHSDFQVRELLDKKFNIKLPQRTTFDDSLTSATSEHEVLNLIIRYRRFKG